jgi:hypothetical protein
MNRNLRLLKALKEIACPLILTGPAVTTEGFTGKKELESGLGASPPHAPHLHNLGTYSSYCFPHLLVYQLLLLIQPPM